MGQKLLLGLLCVIFVAPAQGKLIAHSELVEMTLEQKTQVLEALHIFFAEYSKDIPSGNADKGLQSSLFFLKNAYASDNFNCFYGGWPSKRRSANGRSFCTSPANTNQAYRDLSQSCGANQLACQPVLFGRPPLCVPNATSAQRSRTFANCEERFKSSGRSLSQVAAESFSASNAMETDEVLRLADQVCATGNQARTGMCRILKERVDNIRTQRPAQSTSPGASSRNAPRNTPEATDNNTSATAQADTPSTSRPNRPRRNISVRIVSPESEQVEREVGEIVRTLENPTLLGHEVGDPNCPIQNARPTQRQSRQRKVRCPQAPPISSSSIDISEQALAREGIILPRPPQQRPSETQLRQFMYELNKFPAPLRQELKQAGGRIHLIVGHGVSDDPTWALEMSRARPSERNRWITSPDGQGRRWTEIPGSGGFVGEPRTPTRIVINRLYEGHGSCNLILHEHAHTLDSMYGPGQHSFSKSSTWRNLMRREPGLSNFLRDVCGAHCDLEGETFSELFAYYHGCAESRQHMEQAVPRIADFFKNFRSMQAIRQQR